MQWVFDASIALAWCYFDERTAKSDQLLDRAITVPAVVPEILSLEVANVLSFGRAKRRISDADSEQFLRMLMALPVSIDIRAMRDIFRDVLPIAERYALTAYDASYLELAIRVGIPLATSDVALQKAARAAGVELL